MRACWMAQGTLLGSVVTYMGKEFFKEGIYIVFFFDSPNPNDDSLKGDTFVSQFQSSC